MKTFYSTFLILLFPIFLFSQEISVEEISVEQSEEVKIAKQEIGFNTTDFFKRLISFNELEIFDPNAYLFTYKILLSHRRGLRFGVNADYFKTEQEFTVNNNSGQELKSYSFDLRMGYMYQMRLAKRWSSYVSIDLVGGLSESETKQSDIFFGSNVKAKTSYFGGGPALGVQFFLNSKVSLSTEMTLYYKYREAQDEQDFDANGVADEVIKTKGGVANIGSPASLYLNFRF